MKQGFRQGHPMTAGGSERATRDAGGSDKSLEEELYAELIYDAGSAEASD